MHILMVTSSFHPSVGGVETHVRRVSECLLARGHRVTILTHADQPGEATLGSLAIQRLPKTNPLAAWRLARPHLAAADIVHCHDAYAYLHFCLPSSLLAPRRPTFITYHGYEGYPIPPEAIRKRRFVRRRVKDALCAGEFICRWYGTKCFGVTYGGVDPIPDPPPVPGHTTAVFIGRLAEDTSLLTYLEALAILKQERGVAIPLTVIGDGPLRVPAELYAEGQKLDAQFVGTLPDPTQYLAQADLAFVSGYLAIWQALAMRRLVFAVYENVLKRDYLTCFPESSEVMGIAPDAENLAELLAAHSADPRGGRRRRAKGAALAAEHTWDKVADLYLEMYNSHGLSS